MPNRLVGLYPERITVPPSGLAGYQLYVWNNRTTTQAPLFNEDGGAISQPVISDAAGVFHAHPYADGALYTVMILDPTDVELPGFPKHDIPAIGGNLSDASGIPFAPTNLLPFTNVQAAVQGAADIGAAQQSLVARSFTPLVTAGSGAAYTIAPTPAITALTIGLAFLIVPNRASVGADTLNVNGTGARALRRYSDTTATTAVAAGDLQPGRPALVTYDGTNWVAALDYGRPLGGVSGSYRYERTPDWQTVINAHVTFSFATADTLTASLVLPVAFSEQPVAAIVLPTTVLGTYSGVLRSAIGGPFIGGLTGGVNIGAGLYRATGAADFESGDSITNVSVALTGKWR
jgi:hypothetical protein